MYLVPAHTLIIIINCEALFGFPIFIVRREDTRDFSRERNRTGIENISLDNSCLAFSFLFINELHREPRSIRGTVQDQVMSSYGTPCSRSIAFAFSIYSAHVNSFRNPIWSIPSVSQQTDIYLYSPLTSIIPLSTILS